MDRNFSESEMNEIIQISLKINDNVLPYLCRENYSCRYSIARHFATVKKHNLVPETYWHGSSEEFEGLLVLLSDDYPYPGELLSMAHSETGRAIRNIVNYHYQHVVVMFSHVKRHHGYDILRPTEYMTTLYPHAAGKLYVYTNEIWNYNESHSIKTPFLLIDESQLSEIRSLIHKKVYGY
jgi:hypothetical protein